MILFLIKLFVLTIAIFETDIAGSHDPQKSIINDLDDKLTSIIDAKNYLLSHSILENVTPEYQMYTVAGNGVAGSANNNARATSSSIYSPEQVFVDSAGDKLYFAERNNNRRFRIVDLNSGITNVFAGNGDPADSTGNGGRATSATFKSPSGICAGFTSGVVYVADNDGNNVRRITNGVINSYAGTGAISGTPTTNGDGGKCTAATFRELHHITIDTSNNLFIADGDNNKVRKIDPTNSIITAVAGRGVDSVSGDGGPATSATLMAPYAVYMDSTGVMFISDVEGHNIRRVGTDKKISTFAGNGGTTYAENEPASATGVPTPIGVWGNTIGNIFISVAGHSRLRMVNGITNLINTMAGTGTTSASVFTPSGLALSIPTVSARGLWGDATGTLYMGEYSIGTGGSAIRALYESTQSPSITPTSAPTAMPSISPTPAPSCTPTTVPSSAPTISPSRVPTVVPSITPTTTPSTTPSAIPTIVPTTNPTITPTQTPSTVPSMVPSANPSVSPTTTPSISPTRSPSATPSISQQPTVSPTASAIPAYQMYTIAGNSVEDAAANAVVASSSSIGGVEGVFVDNSNTLFFAESVSRQCRKVNLNSGIMYVYAGIAGGTYAGTGDGGQATGATFIASRGIAVNALGIGFVSDFGDHKVRKIASDGIITRVVGTGTASATATAVNGDTGKATAATIANPVLIALDSNSNLYIADFSNRKIRKVDAGSQVITTIAGTGASNTSGDGGFATSASLPDAVGVFVDAAGRVLIATWFGIRKIGTDNKISSFAGSGALTAPLDNVPATSTPINGPFGVWGNTLGDIYFADGGNNRLRIVTAESGLVNSVAGNGATATAVYVSSGLALNIPLLVPRGVWGDNTGRVFVSTVQNAVGGNVVRMVYPLTQSPSATPSVTPSVVPSICPSVLPSVVPSATPTITPSVTPSRLPTVLPSVVPSIVPSFVPSVTPSCTPSMTPSVVPSRIPSAMPSTNPTTSPSTTPTTTPTVAPTVGPTATPTVTPTVLPSLVPTSTPSILPSCVPSLSPSTVPSLAPSSTPSVTPTNSPSETPTQSPCVIPSPSPSVMPSVIPSEVPSSLPTMTPTVTPTKSPSVTPSITPSNPPTVVPSHTPSVTPSHLPSPSPTEFPTAKPSPTPTMCPSAVPSLPPTYEPTIAAGEPTPLPVTAAPSGSPSKCPTSLPTTTPTAMPSVEPTTTPSETPSVQPSQSPTMTPTETPTTLPSELPSEAPTIVPTDIPTTIPSTIPTTTPSVLPSVMPSCVPTENPSNDPTTQPSEQPTTAPSDSPTDTPTISPSGTPSSAPTATPSLVPSQLPTAEPSTEPSAEPTAQPSSPPLLSPSPPPTPQPSQAPSELPSIVPTSDPTGQPTIMPSILPTVSPSEMPTQPPSTTPSVLPSGEPTSADTTNPTLQPTVEPTNIASTEPARSPSNAPSLIPTIEPSTNPRTVPSAEPSIEPSKFPTITPSHCPTLLPSAIPSISPTCIPSNPLPTHSPTTTAPTVTKSRGSFPTNSSLSVLHDATPYNVSVGTIVVLPFLRVTVTANALQNSGFYSLNLISSSAGAVASSYVLFGNISSNRVNLIGLTNSAGYVVTQAVSYDYSGRSVSNAGDINGDGYNDLIIGVPYAARCYVLFGTAQGFVNMTEGFTIFGQADSMTGWSVSGAGDVNNDTVSDFVIGSPYARFQNMATGAAYVFYGKRSGHENINLETELSPSQGFVIYGAAYSEMLGVSVSSAGDVNGDGLDDIVVGALKSTSSYRGGAYVIFGSLESQNAVHLSTLTSSQGVAFTGPVWSYTGYSVSGAGDVNDDGFDDVLIGSVPFRTTFGTQLTYLVYGGLTTSFSDLSSMTKKQGVVISGGGVVVSGVGDINHDGYDDILVGSNYGFNGGGFVTYRDTSEAPTISPTQPPTQLPTTVPTIIPSRTPTIEPSRTPTRDPTLRPSRQPTVQHSGPSEPPTEAPTGPTSTPSSLPSISTEHPSSRPTTNFPSSRPSGNPSSKPSVLSSAGSAKPTLCPTLQPSVSHRPTVSVSTPTFRSRNPLLSIPSTIPTSVEESYNMVLLSSGKTYVRQSDKHYNFVIDTNETVSIVGAGHSGGDIYTVLPYVNGSLHIEIFNNISDKLNLTSHSTFHSMSDLVITSGSVIITFPTTGQIIRLTNLTPLDISENNFMFSRSTNAASNRESIVSGTLVIAFSSAALLLVAVFIVYQLYRRAVTRKEKTKLYKEGIIALEDNPTRLIIAVNDMYAHFDAYTPNNQSGSNDSNQLHNGSSESLYRVSGESKSNENSPLNSFETQNNNNIAYDKEYNSSNLFSSGDLCDAYQLESGDSQRSSNFDVSMDSDLMSYTGEKPEAAVEPDLSESDNDHISMDSDLMSQV